MTKIRSSDKERTLNIYEYNSFKYLYSPVFKKTLLLKDWYLNYAKLHELSFLFLSALFVLLYKLIQININVSISIIALVNIFEMLFYTSLFKNKGDLPTRKEFSLIKKQLQSEESLRGKLPLELAKVFFLGLLTTEYFIEFGLSPLTLFSLVYVLSVIIYRALKLFKILLTVWSL